jgi:hypothetical protein
MATKYIRTKENEIIVFSALLNHSEFRRFEPISAGFILFTTDQLGNPNCECYGESVSLGFLKSKPVEDSKLANIQILGTFL